MWAWVEQAWQAVGGEAADLGRLELTGPAGTLPARLPVTDLAVATASAAGLAAARYVERSSVRVDTRGVAVAFTSERHLRDAGEPPGIGFAAESGFFPTRDGWVRTHANYPHHLARLRAVLGPGELAPAIAERGRFELEQAAVEAGALAVAVRSPQEWTYAPAGPLVAVDRTGEGPPHRVRPRVLDLTRVIAGPVAGRTLALLGADVLRVDPPEPAELPAQHLDTGFGKRSTLLNLTTVADRRTFDGLLATADVVLLGYRPGTLARFGLVPEQLHARYPNLVIASLSAWGQGATSDACGASVSWRGRRGFDSLVQAASGIAVTEADGARPGALPAQALDHGTGYLLAAATLLALRRGGGHAIEASLARTAAWLQSGIGAAAAVDVDPEPWLGRLGKFTHALPPFRFDDTPLAWADGPVAWGTSAPAWLL